MKDYINAETRHEISAFLLSVSLSEKLLQDKKISKEEKKYLKYAQTYASKYLVELMKRVEQKEGLRLIKMVETHSIILKDKKNKSIKTTYMNMPTEAVEDLIEIAVMDKCKNCRGVNFYNCKLFNIQQDLCIFNVQDRKGFCPYAYDAANKECRVLTEMICAKQKCNFFKTKRQANPQDMRTCIKCNEKKHTTFYKDNKQVCNQCHWHLVKNNLMKPKPKIGVWHQ